MDVLVPCLDLEACFLYIGITCAEISYIKLGLSLAFSCSPLPDPIYHIGTSLKNDRASRSLLRQVCSHLSDGLDSLVASFMQAFISRWDDWDDHPNGKLISSQGPLPLG